MYLSYSSWTVPWCRDASTLPSNSSTMLLSSWKRETALEDDDFRSLDDLSGVAGARCTGERGPAEMLADDR